MGDTINSDWKLEGYWVLEGRGFGRAFQEQGKHFCLILCLNQLGNDMDNVVPFMHWKFNLMAREDFFSRKAYRPGTGEQWLNYDSCLLVEQLNQQVITFSCTGLSHQSKNYLRMFKSRHKTGFWQLWLFCGQKQYLPSRCGCDSVQVPQPQNLRVFGSRFPSGASEVLRPEHL